MKKASPLLCTTGMMPLSSEVTKNVQKVSIPVSWIGSEVKDSTVVEVEVVVDDSDARVGESQEAPFCRAFNRRAVCVIDKGGGVDTPQIHWH